MDLRILGPVVAAHAGQCLELGRRRERFLLALLALDPGRAVPADRLSALLWEGDPPDDYARGLQINVSRLRARLRVAGDDAPRLVATGGGYLLDASPDNVDASRFRRMVERAPGVEDPESRCRLLRSALALWRGRALSGVTSDEQRERLAAGLEELREQANVLLYEQELALGRHATVVTELTDIVERDPLRERLVALLLTALDRQGRGADALVRYHLTRTRLAEELGVEPGPQLREVYATLLGDRPSRQEAVPAVPTRPAQLPALPGGFTGRSAELDLLHKAAADCEVIVIAGGPGIGKTSLAVRWAYDLMPGHPDGQLFLNLRGFTQGPPMSPADALGVFLRTLSVPPGRIPSDVDEAAALFRSLVAGKRMLILLDNAADAEQVRPLLPGSGCTVVITSRDALTGLVAREGARMLTLSTLRPEETVTLLSGMLGAHRADPAACADLAAACGHLPLAARIAAADLNNQPHRSIEDYVAALRGGQQLATLHLDDDPSGSVRSAFANSHKALTAPARQLFALLGLLPGADVAVPTAAELAGWPAEQTRRVLRRLTDAHLVEAAGSISSPDRFTQHDLLRLYARERAGADLDAAGRTAAMDRLQRHYLSHADAASRLLNPQMLRLPSTGPTPSLFASSQDARRWLDAEYANLAALINHCATEGLDTTAYRLADSLRGYLWMRYDLTQWTAIASAAVAAAERAADPHAIISARISLAQSLHCAGEYSAGAEDYERALAQARAVGWVQAQATAIGNTAVIWLGVGEQRRCIAACEESIRLYRDLGQPSGEAVNLGTMGLAHLIGGDLRLAERHLSAAVRLHRRLGADSMLVISLSHLGEALRQLGEHDRAGAVLAKAIDLARRIGARSAESVASHYKARLHLDRAEVAGAETWAGLALSICDETGNTFASAYALIVLGEAHLWRGRTAEAIDCQRQALGIAHSSQERHPEVRGLNALAETLLATGDLAGAASHAGLAHELAARSDYRTELGRATLIQARLCHARGEQALEQALEHAQQAWQLLHGTGHRQCTDAAAQFLHELGETVT